MTYAFHDLRARNLFIYKALGKSRTSAVLRLQPRTWDVSLQNQPRVCKIVGGAISPMLANVYLHYVLDEWFEREVKPRLRGRAYLVRYADDLVIVFEYEDDARRVMAVLGRRFEKYGLAVHPTKTRLIDFRRPNGRREERSADRDDRSPRDSSHTFDLLGFTHYWGRSRRGTWVVKRKTSSKSLTRAVQNIDRWCRVNRHRPIADQHAQLSRKISGHYAYYGITGNALSLRNFLYLVHRTWRKWLSRRSRKRKMSWDGFNRLLERYVLPPIRVVHSVYIRVANP